MHTVKGILRTMKFDAHYGPSRCLDRNPDAAPPLDLEKPIKRPRKKKKKK